MGRAIALVVAFSLAASAPLTGSIGILARDGPPSAPQGTTPGAETAQSPPPQKAIAGLVGFESTSVLTYEDAPGAAHRLIATYIFPDRVRWFLGLKDAKTSERQMRYRSGERAFSIDAHSARSRELEGQERSVTLQQMELRRATMLWPDGFEWKLVGGEARVDLGPLGTLRAQFENPPSSLADKESSPAPRPVRVALLGDNEEEQDSFRALTWRELRGRKWPASAELWHTGKRIWREQFESVETSIRFVDAYFLPADRRDNPVPPQPQVGDVQHLDLPGTVVCRVELDPGGGWEKAVLEASRQRDLWSPRLQQQGLELDPKITIELTAQARPAACILRLSTAPPTPPAGFSSLSPRAAIAMLVGGLSDVTTAKLSTLELARPKASQVLAPYVRFDRDQARIGPVLLVLPLAGKH